MHLRRRNERREALLELHRDHVPATRDHVHRALDDPTDLATLAKLSTSSEGLLRTALIARGWVYELATDICRDSQEFERDIQFVSPRGADPPMPLTPSEVARRERWHLQQADDLLIHLEAETSRRIAPPRRLAHAGAGVRGLLRRRRAKREWRRDVRRG